MRLNHQQKKSLVATQIIQIKQIIKVKKNIILKSPCRRFKSPNKKQYLLNRQTYKNLNLLFLFKIKDKTTKRPKEIQKSELEVLVLLQKIKYLNQKMKIAKLKYNQKA